MGEHVAHPVSWDVDFFGQDTLETTTREAFSRKKLDGVPTSAFFYKQKSHKRGAKMHPQPQCVQD